MSDQPNLNEQISERFREEIEARIAPGESVKISLPGSFGEALVVTEKRAFILRERPSGPNPELDIHTYWLSAVAGARAEAQGTSGFIELGVESAKSDPDSARVYFPAYDIDKFKTAAQAISELAMDTKPDTAVISAPEATAGQICPKCNAAVTRDAAFCVQCGEQLAPMCAYCGRVSTGGASYCPGCGNKMLEQPTACPACGARITRWQAYCAECGSVLVMSCAGCGSVLLPDDKHCRSCGRLLGAGRIDPRAARAMHARMAAAQAQPRPEEPAQEAVPPAASDAESHNRRGRELFEQEDVEGAINEFRLAVAMAPDNASYHCNLAVAYDENDQDDLALQEYERTLQLDPNDLTALLSLGYMYSENDQLEKARQAWDKILEIAPLSAEAQEVQDNLRHQGEI